MEGAAWIPLAISGNPVETANLAVSNCQKKRCPEFFFGCDFKNEVSSEMNGNSEMKRDAQIGRLHPAV